MLLRADMMPARTWGVSTCGCDGSHGRVEIEETDGSSSRQKEYELIVLVNGSIWLGSRGGALDFGHSVLGRRSLDGKMVPLTERSVDEANSRGSIMEAGKRSCRSSDVRDP